MDWEQKLQALKALGAVSLKMRKPGDWYVSQSVEVGGDGLLRSDFGNGISPAKAVENHWDQLTNLPKGKYLVYRDNTGERKQVTWNGFMWEAYS